MSVYVGIDVHRKRSQVAVVGQDGEVLVNRNVPNGVNTILGVIGGLPAAGPNRHALLTARAPMGAETSSGAGFEPATSGL